VGGGGGTHLGPLDNTATNTPIVSDPGDYDDGENWWNDDWQEKTKYSEKTCSSAVLSTTNPTCSARTRTRVGAVGSQRLTAWATARPYRAHDRESPKPTLVPNIFNYTNIFLFLNWSAISPLKFHLLYRMPRKSRVRTASRDSMTDTGTKISRVKILPTYKFCRKRGSNWTRHGDTVQ
jgi:hypothetical protein